ncbi:MAG: site-specific DNA-methyltransferase, partial [Oscillospiraceae bacterium]|nr:site-specific DNA-methyltransferase [Oscillospiraceae bacterium]
VMEGYEAVGIEVTDVYYKLGVDRVRFALEAQEKSEETAGQ